MADKVQSITFSLDEDLAAPSFFLDAVSDLRIILSAYDSSLAPITTESAELSSILESALWPYIQLCENLSESLSKLSRCIVLSNCYDLAQVTPS